MTPPQDKGGTDAPDLKIEESTSRFIGRKRPNWNGSTPRTYRKDLDTFEAWAEENDVETVSDLNLWLVGTYTDWLLAHDYSKATVQSKQKKARRWIKWMESQGLVEKGLHLAIETLKLTDEEQSSSDILPPVQLREILEYYRDSPQWRGTRRHALLEVVAHTGARRIGLRALDLDDWDPEERTLTFVDRDEQGSRLKEGKTHQRKVVLSETPAEILEEYIARDRYEKHDNMGRQPLFTSRQGRPDRSTLTNWLYRATIPCIRKECPHGRKRHTCEWTQQTKASRCPSSFSPHPIRRGSITWQLNIGKSIEDVANRAGTTPPVIRRYYDKPDLDNDLRRRVDDFNSIDICEHQNPDDIEKELDEGETDENQSTENEDNIEEGED